MSDGSSGMVVQPPSSSVGRQQQSSVVSQPHWLDRPVRDGEALLAAAVVGAAHGIASAVVVAVAVAVADVQPLERVVATAVVAAAARVLARRPRGTRSARCRAGPWSTRRGRRRGRSSRRSCPSRTRSRPATPAAPGRRARSCRCRTSARPRGRCRGRSRRRRFELALAARRSPRSTGTGMCPRTGTRSPSGPPRPSCTTVRALRAATAVVGRVPRRSQGGGGGTCSKGARGEAAARALRKKEGWLALFRSHARGAHSPSRSSTRRATTRG